MFSSGQTMAGEYGTIRYFDRLHDHSTRTGLPPQEWARRYGSSPRIVRGIHRGRRKDVRGFELVIGDQYTVVVATAHHVADLYLWACLRNYSAETIWAKSPSVRRSRALRQQKRTSA